MARHSFLFYSDKNEASQYSHTPPGHLKVVRMLQGKTPWKKYSLSSEQKQKTLILADWTASQWTKRKKSEAFALLNDLLAEGFSIYLWQEGRLDSLSLEKLFVLEALVVREQITPEFYQVIFDAAFEQHRLSQHQIQILDDYWLNVLLNPEGAVTSRSLSMGALLKREDEMDKILSIVEQSMPPLEVIEANEFSLRASNLLIKLQKRFSTVVVDPNHDTLILEDGFDLDAHIQYPSNALPVRFNIMTLNVTYTADDAKRMLAQRNELSLLLKKMPILRTLNVVGLCLNEVLQEEAHLPRLEELCVLDSNYSASMLRLLLANTIHLKKLEVSGSEDLSQILETLPQLSKLEALIIHGNDHQIDLLAILGKKNHLKKLQLINVGVVCDNLMALQIDSLEALLVHASDFKGLSPLHLLEKKHCIRSLDLKNVTSNVHMTREDIHLEQLEELSLSINNESGGNALFNILSRAPELKELKLEGFDYLSDIIKTGINLPCLEKLNLQKATLDWESLRLLLSNTTGLKQLIFYDCSGLEADGGEGLSLDALEEIKMSHTLFTPNSFFNLLKTNECLKRLYIHFCGSMASIEPTELAFYMLEELRLGSPTFHRDYIVSLLANNHRLKVIELTNIVFPNDFDKKKLNHAHLDTLVLNEIELFESDLAHLLAESKHLNTLHLSGISIVEDDASLSKTNLYLPELRCLIIEGSTLSEKIIEALQVAAPNLKEALLNGNDAPEENEPVANEHASMTVDADTAPNPDIQLEVTRYFTSLDGLSPDPIINNYRLQLFHNLAVNPDACSLDQAFTLNNPDSANFLPCYQALKYSLDDLVADLPTLDGEGFYVLGKKAFELTTHWQPIASLSPYEQLKRMHVMPMKASVEICYSSRDNLYYIRSDKSCDITLSFVLAIPSQASVQIPEETLQLIEKVKHFGQASLKIDKPNPHGQDYLDALCQQQVGSCRHRVIVFKAMMNEYHPSIPVRINMNDCHALIELMIDGVWVNVDLGGYPASLIISAAPDQSENLEDAASPTATAPFEAQLETWKRGGDYLGKVSDYCQLIAQSITVKKRLIELESFHEVQALQLSLQVYCNENDRPCFYIHQPDDLVCQAPFIHQQTGLEMPGPGGPLYDFLISHSGRRYSPILMVNYANFDADDLIRLNGLLDDHRLADGVALSPDTLVIGFINTKKPGYYQGEDFYSRFDEADKCPLHATLLMQQLPDLPGLCNEDDDVPSAIINLYHGRDWEERLLGYWAIDGDRFYFVQGELERALGTGLPIEIQNGPWNNEHFLLLWRQACLLGTIPIADQIISLPAGLQWRRREGYHWKALRTMLTLQDELKPRALVLNPSSFTEFFSQYSYDNSKKTLSMRPGLLHDHTDESLDMNLTRDLSEDEWAMILDRCLKQKTQLRLCLAPGTSLPECITEMAPEPFMDKSLPEWDGRLDAHTLMIKSTDIDCTLLSTTPEGFHGDSHWQIIDVSECEASDLLTHIHPEREAATGRRIFERTSHALLTALEEKKQVVLKGSFSPTLMDALAPLLLGRISQLEASGRLILLSEQAVFPCFPSVSHTVTQENKRTALLTLFSHEELERLPDGALEESLSQLQARLVYCRIYPGAPSDDAWQGLLKLPSDRSVDDFDPVKSRAVASDFIQKRVADINRYLEHAPYVFLTGLTGVGKTSFVQKYLKNDWVELFQGIDNVLQWVNDTSSKQKILFIDEANLTHRQWSEFEGLFHHQPGMLLDGHFYSLSAQHKVIFAGNPIQYGDERKLAPFFERHGNALVFEPMPMAFIYEAILKPVFHQSRIADCAQAICRPILDVYRFLCERSTGQLLISPRELQMMALLVSSYTYYQVAGSEASITAARHYAYQIGVNLVPKSHRAAFDDEFMPTDELGHWVVDCHDKISSNFLMTHSRNLIRQQLGDLLILRDFRQLHGLDAVRYGGLGGTVLEGEPGIGKSEMVMSCLAMHGYQLVNEMRDFDEKELPEKHFYQMPAGMPIDEKKRLLLTAFQEGAVVVCDEMNSSPMMESYLNALLMGKTPSGAPPRKPGFFIIGTQNPASMAGRRQVSLALARRLMTLEVKAYAHDDMMAILTHHAVPDKMAKVLVTAYEKTVGKAAARHLSPRPVFRDLLKLAKSYTGLSSMDVDAAISDAKALVTNGLFSRKRMNAGSEASDAKAQCLRVEESLVRS